MRSIADAAFKLEKDKVSEPVTGQLGKTVLLRVTEIEPGKEVTFEEAKPELEKKMLKERAQTAIFDLHDKIEDERASGTQLAEVAGKFKLNYQVFDQLDRRGQAADGTAPASAAEIRSAERRLRHRGRGRERSARRQG